MFLQLSLLASLKSSRASSRFSLVTTLVVWVAPTTLRQMWRSEKTQEYKVTKWNYSHREFLKLVFYPKTEVELASSPGLRAKPKIHTRTTERSASSRVTSSVASTYVTTKYILMLNSLYYHVQPAYNINEMRPLWSDKRGRHCTSGYFWTSWRHAPGPVVDATVQTMRLRLYCQRHPACRLLHPHTWWLARECVRLHCN